MPAGRPFVLAAIMAAMFTIAVEATIVSTAMPQIAGQLGQLHLYSWAFSAFLLGQTATVVIFGKLADMFGRKPVLLVGLAVFTLGSVLCGLAWTMPSLIAFRLVQGVGAGAIQPICLTIVGDLYPPRERGKIQGYLASVWGVSSVLGPLAGGLIIARMSWSWIFWLNVPLCLAAAGLFVAALHEDVPRRVRAIDAPGAVLFAVAAASLLIAMTELGTSDRMAAFAGVAVFVVSATLFVRQEQRAPEPMLHFGLWARRSIWAANATNLLGSMVVIGLTSFLPMFVQGVLGRSALTAGFAMTMMILGWPLASSFAARVYMRHGLRPTMIAGASLLPLGAAVFLLLGAGSSPLVVGLGSTIVGLGMGLMSVSAMIMVQSSVGWSERGSATASFVFSRNLGSTLGATLLGGVLNYSLARNGGVAFDAVRGLLDHSGAADGVQAALAQGLHATFWGVFVVAGLTLLAAWQVPNVSLTARQDAPPDEAEAMARLHETAAE